jgi:hypothetical protein
MFSTYLLLCLAAILAGAINSVAGGGTLLTFPSLTAVFSALADGDVRANATSTVALWPASMAALWGYREEFRRVPRWSLWLAVPSLIGGIIGSLLVIAYPNTFKTLVPWLILTAAILFTLQPYIARWFGIGSAHHTSRGSSIAVFAFQLLVAIYGGYFGAGIGILMLTALGLLGLSDIHEMNALKNLLGSLINGISVVIFVASGKVEWNYALAMMVASMIGGYGCALIAKKLDRRLVRALVISIGFVLATVYFYRQFGTHA